MSCFARSDVVRFCSNLSFLAEALELYSWGFFHFLHLCLYHTQYKHKCKNVFVGGSKNNEVILLQILFITHRVHELPDPNHSIRA